MTKTHEGVGGETPSDHPAEHSGEMVLRGEKSLLIIFRAALTREYRVKFLAGELTLCCRLVKEETWTLDFIISGRWKTSTMCCNNFH